MEAQDYIPQGTSDAQIKEYAVKLFKMYLLESLYRFITTDKKHGRDFSNNLYRAFGIRLDNCEEAIRQGYAKRTLLTQDSVQLHGLTSYNYPLTCESDFTISQMVDVLLENYVSQLNSEKFGLLGKKGSTFFKKVIKFIEDSGVMSHLTVAQLALYTYCRIRTDLSENDWDGNLYPVVKSITPEFDDEVTQSLKEFYESNPLRTIQAFQNAEQCPRQIQPRETKGHSQLRKHVARFLALPQVKTYVHQEQEALSEFSSISSETLPLEPMTETTPIAKIVPTPDGDIFYYHEGSVGKYFVLDKDGYSFYRNSIGPKTSSLLDMAYLEKDDTQLMCFAFSDGLCCTINLKTDDAYQTSHITDSHNPTLSHISIQPAHPDDAKYMAYAVIHVVDDGFDNQIVGFDKVSMSFEPVFRFNLAQNSKIEAFICYKPDVLISIDSKRELYIFKNRQYFRKVTWKDLNAADYKFNPDFFVLDTAGGRNNLLVQASVPEFTLWKIMLDQLPLDDYCDDSILLDYNSAEPFIDIKLTNLSDITVSTLSDSNILFIGVKSQEKIFGINLKTERVVCEISMPTGQMFPTAIQQGTRDSRLFLGSDKLYTVDISAINCDPTSQVIREFTARPVLDEVDELPAQTDHPLGRTVDGATRRGLFGRNPGSSQTSDVPSWQQRFKAKLPWHRSAEPSQAPQNSNDPADHPEYDASYRPSSPGGSFDSE